MNLPDQIARFQARNPESWRLLADPRLDSNIYDRAADLRERAAVAEANAADALQAARTGKPPVSLTRPSLWSQIVRLWRVWTPDALPRDDAFADVLWGPMPDALRIGRGVEAAEFRARIDAHPDWELRRINREEGLS